MTVDVSTVRDRYARWQTNVAGVLAKSTRKAVEDLPADPERLLDSPTYDGFPVRPLYTSLDGLAEPALPGHWPFTRGGDAHRDVLAGWKVAESFPIASDADVATVNGAILLALTDGTSALEVRVGSGGVPVDQLDRVFEGVFLDLVPVLLDAGADLAGAADQLLTLVKPFDADQRARLSIDLGADPLTAPLSGRTAATEADVVATAAKLTDYDGGVRAVTVDAAALHNLGASASLELAGAIAAGVAYLRLLTESGLSAADALRQLSFRYAADDDQFATIAKLRAARQLWARVAEVVGDPAAGGAGNTKEAGAAVIHAVTSKAMMSQRDPWVNMLRTTLAAFAAGVGGADTVLVETFDAAIDGGLPGTAVTFSRRMARNTQLLLLEESHLGRVVDPSGGSWFVEDLTDQLAQQAWAKFQELESLGGFVAARDHLSAQIAEVAARRADDIAHRRTALTGVNEFPNLAETPLAQTDSFPGVVRYAAAFEALRNRSDAYLAKTGKRPQAVLLPVGPLAEHNIRTTFAANLLASGGIEAVNPGTVDAAGVAAAAAGQVAAVVCGTDARYAEEASDVVKAARAAGVAHVYLAGPEKAVENTVDASARPDEYLTMKIDAVEALSTLLTRLGA
ncbi:methylmalonyl-CoA mutase small subunit [Mycolicibacterium mucogenicum]|uniref:Methylmalonyl-CoA mutase small subunit n=1 Tax=Mycolicibacterium mucogenicum DSM 44124 TaxID=1226753 RepID=A0A8E4RCF9_MYCMU|nr:methylmalonyl-CoA mutase small subunit [Mycolicibacterium mucogenicum]KAB7759417.1 methylmalonyl-CoA mutase [Mycolicibacterium mucogenicum DSM 44124]QPG71892.1 methylmalonyl-CoA mutase small subunit [Mycolicibacterium mucogenicum DSM 44124]